MKRLLSVLLISFALSANPTFNALLTPPFNPAFAGGTVVFWVDVKQEPAQTTGTAIAPLNDWSASNNDFVQATGSLQGLYTTGAINSFPAVLLDGTDDFYSAGDLSATEGIGSFSLGAVFKANTLGGNYAVISKLLGTTDGSWFLAPASGPVLRGTVVNTTPTRVNADTGAPSTGVNYIMLVIYDGATITVRVNGNLLTASAAQTGNTQNTTHNVQIGRHSTTINTYFPGYVGETFFVAGEAWNTAEQDAAFSLLGTKWGISITP